MGFQTIQCRVRQELARLSSAMIYPSTAFDLTTHFDAEAPVVHHSSVIGQSLNRDEIVFIAYVKHCSIPAFYVL
jgi:hypothetical protein